MTTNAQPTEMGLCKLSKRRCITDWSLYYDGYPRAYASSICSITESRSYELARMYSVKQTIFTISSFETEGFMSGESFENLIHSIIVIAIDAWRKLHTYPTQRGLDNQMRWDLRLTTKTWTRYWHWKSSRAFTKCIYVVLVLICIHVTR